MSSLTNSTIYNKSIESIISNSKRTYQNTLKASKNSNMFKKGFKINEVTNTNMTVNNNNNNNNNNNKNNLRKVTIEKSGKELLIKIKSNVKNRLENNINKKEIEKKQILKKYYITRGLMLSSVNKDKIKKLDENIEYYKSIIDNVKKNINQAKKEINELNKDNTKYILVINRMNKIKENKEKLDNIQNRKKIIFNKITKKQMNTINY